MRKLMICSIAFLYICERKIGQKDCGFEKRPPSTGLYLPKKCGGIRPISILFYPLMNELNIFDTPLPSKFIINCLFIPSSDSDNKMTI
jgi:hypothetical protein